MNITCDLCAYFLFVFTYENIQRVRLQIKSGTPTIKQLSIVSILNLFLYTIYVSSR
jgi:hypothetical protein